MIRHQTLVGCGLATALAIFTLAHDVAAQRQPVRTATGLLAGVPGSDRSVIVYKGVPFAAPPVDNLRWRAPQPAAAWAGVRQADQFGANCMQLIVEKRDPWTHEFMAHGPISEDCLYLNVWTAAGTAERRPVLLFMHGGGLSEGSGSIAAYDGEALARKGLVVVTMNYRLGVLGYMAHPALTSESGGKASGNYGLLDQIAALRWIQQNIAAFGGDPQVVTIAGQSAGASSVHALAASPLAKGLFHRAIAESGSSVAAADPPSLADAEQMGVRLAAAVNAKSTADLRAVPWATLADRTGRNSPFRFGIIVDGMALREPPARTVAAGRHNDVPFLTGTNGDENGAVPNPMMQAAGWAPYAKQRYGAMADAFLALYPAATDADAAAAQNASARDQARTSTHLWALNRLVTSRTRIFTYFFTHPLPGPDAARYGAFHTSEVPYVFNTLNGPDRNYAAADRALADTISSYWVNFAKTGDPNGAGLPQWPAVSAGEALTMELGDMVRPIPVAEKSRLEFFKRFFTRLVD